LPGPDSQRHHAPIDTKKEREERERAKKALDRLNAERKKQDLPAIEEDPLSRLPPLNPEPEWRRVGTKYDGDGLFFLFF
jgi:hypothetical protein